MSGQTVYYFSSRCLVEDIDVSSVEHLYEMFRGAVNFNGDLSKTAHRVMNAAIYNISKHKYCNSCTLSYLGGRSRNKR